MYSLNAAVLVSLCHDGGTSDGRERSDCPGNNNLCHHVVFLAEKRRRRRQGLLSSDVKLALFNFARIKLEQSEKTASSGVTILDKLLTKAAGFGATCHIAGNTKIASFGKHTNVLFNTTPNSLLFALFDREGADLSFATTLLELNSSHDYETFLITKLRLCEFSPKGCGRFLKPATFLLETAAAGALKDYDSQ